MNVALMEEQRVDVLGQVWSDCCACQFISRSMAYFADEPGILEDWDRQRVLRGLSAMLGYVGRDLETVHELVSGWD
jgi:hypothetical protein